MLVIRLFLYGVFNERGRCWPQNKIIDLIYLIRLIKPTSTSQPRAWRPIGKVDQALPDLIRLIKPDNHAD